jgi:hypothetical protein
VKKIFLVFLSIFSLTSIANANFLKNMFSREKTRAKRKNVEKINFNYPESKICKNCEVYEVIKNRKRKKTAFRCLCKNENGDWIKTNLSFGPGITPWTTSKSKNN